MSVSKVCPRCGDEYDASVAFCAKDGTRLVTRAPQQDLVGSVIADRYRIVKRIGEGGMGQVYLAEHVRMKRKSAIKIMRQALVGDVEALQRFTREAENASQIAHPNVAAIFDFGETADGIVYLAMEYVDGTSLAAKLGLEHALHPDVAADILGQAADALQAAHELGILHRDLKPDNIMLGKRSDGTFMVKLVDFGIARTMDGADQKVTRTGFAIGTPAFMSPEQLAGDVLDARSDQYSLALVAFVALTGKDAFPAESSKESLIARLTSRPRTLQEAKEDVAWPAALQAIFDRALSPEPTERFETVAEFGRALATAISAMTPSQTAALYRRALDIRLAHVAMRTPHSDMHSLRTPNAPLATMTPPAPQPTLERAPEPEPTAPPLPASPPTAPRPASTNAAASGAFKPLPPSGTYPTIERPTIAIVTGEEPTPASGEFIVPSAPIVTSSSRRKLPVAAIAGGVAVIAAGIVFAMSGGDDVTPVAADSTAGLATGDSVASVAVTPGAPAGATAGASTVARPAGADSVATALRDSSARARAQRDSLRRALRAYDDSVKRRTALIAQFPEAPVRAAAGGALDARTYTVRENDVRAVIMPPTVVAWRAERVRAYKATNQRPDNAGAYLIVEPIEVWSAWKGITSARRAVYVLEVMADKTPEPGKPEPDKVFDLNRGDIGTVELWRDGAPIPLRDAEYQPAVVNDDAHTQRGKRVPSMLAATLAPEAFAPGADGRWPRLELRVTDKATGKLVRLPIQERMMQRLHADFAPWREMVATLPVPVQPAAPAPVPSAAGATGARTPPPRIPPPSR